MPKTATILSPNLTNGYETFVKLFLFKPNLLYTLRVRRFTELPVPMRTRFTSYLSNLMLTINRSLCNVSVTLSSSPNFTSCLVHGSFSTERTYSGVRLFFPLYPLGPPTITWINPTGSFLSEFTGILTLNSGLLSSLSFLANLLSVPSQWVFRSHLSTICISLQCARDVHEISNILSCLAYLPYLVWAWWAIWFHCHFSSCIWVCVFVSHLKVCNF